MEVQPLPPEPPAALIRLDDEAPRMTIAIQPNPTMVRVVHFRLFRWWVTAIMRHWEKGDSGPGGRCRLCPMCAAYDNGCLKIVSGKVSAREARLLDTVEDKRQTSLMG